MTVAAPRVLYIDFSETATHADTLFSVVRFLAGLEVRYLLDPSYRGFLPDTLEDDRVSWLPAGRGEPAALRAAWCAARAVRRFRPDVVHVNGAQGRRARSFALLTLGSKAVFSGTHHNAAKLLGGGSQQLINLRIRRYGVLADFIRDRIRPELPPKLAVETVRPIFFPRGVVQPPADRLRIAIVGSMDRSRRDYDGLIRLLSGDLRLDPRIELLFLGDASTGSGRAIRAAIQGTKAGPLARFKDSFVSFPELFREVGECHALLPLIHPETPRFNEYLETKISGASLLALGFQKPLVLHDRLAALPDYRGVSIGYDVPELPRLLNRLAAFPDELERVARGFNARQDLDFARESRRYRELLGIP